MNFNRTKHHNNANIKCCVDGCNNIIDGKHKNYCNKHYKQIYKHKQILDRTVFTKNDILICDTYAEIVLYDKYCKPIAVAIIDIEDVDKCKNYKWGINNNGYAVNNTNHILLHRFILNINESSKDLVCDHINRNRLDNRKSNLRIITKSENCFNRSNVKGYYKLYNGKFQAIIKKNGNTINLGVFNTEDSAKIARNIAENKLFNNIKYNEKISS